MPTRGFDGKTLAVREPPAGAEAVRLFARLQIDQAGEVTRWSERGCPDQGLVVMKRRLPKLLIEIPERLRECGVLTQGERDEIAAFVPQAAELCRQLSEFSTPRHSIHHEDFRAGNVLRNQNGDFIILDWHELVVAHPFFSLQRFLWFVERPEGASRHQILDDESDELRRGLRDAYLEPFAVFEPRGRLLEAFHISCLLAPVYDTLRFESGVDLDAVFRRGLDAESTRIARELMSHLLDVARSAKQAAPGERSRVVVPFHRPAPVSPRETCSTARPASSTCGRFTIRPATTPSGSPPGTRCSRRTSAPAAIVFISRPTAGCSAPRARWCAPCSRSTPDVPPADWRFATGERGKPYIVAPELATRLHFNLTNTHGLVACAVSVAHTAVGVDAEVLDRPGETVALADRYFSSYEVRALRALPPEQQRARFFAYWTLKESYIKARGLGLALPLDQFSFQLDGEAEIGIAFDARMGDDPRRWRFALLDAGPAHLAAVGVDTGGAPLSLRGVEFVPLSSPADRPAQLPAPPPPWPRT